MAQKIAKFFSLTLSFDFLAYADKEKHDAVMVRREAFGDWLKAVVEETVQREIAEIKEDDRLILSLLTGKKKQRNKKMCLSLKEPSCKKILRVSIFCNCY